MAQPNPNAFLVELLSSGQIAARLIHAGLPALSGFNPLADIETIGKTISDLKTSDDPVLKRLGFAIAIAGSKYGTALAKPFGYYATIALHNAAIDDHWDGGSQDDPYGAPNTPA